MILDKHIHPTGDQFKKMIETVGMDQPVTMVNILKFKSDNVAGELSGEDVYARYGQKALPFLKKAQARLVWRGNVKTTLIGDADDIPDVMLIVSYPSLKHFVDMVTDPAYVKISEDRTMSIEYGGLYVCDTEYPVVE